MFDTEKVEQEVVQEQPEAAEVQELAQEQQQEAQPVPQAKPFNQNAENIRMLREKSERMEREKMELERRLREYEEKMTPSAATSDEEDYTLNLGENDLAEGKHLTKLQKQVKKQQESLLKMQQQTQAMLVETRLKAEHSDIDKVVTEENIKTLKELYPEIASTLNSSTDYYNKAKAAYTMIKKLGIHVEDNFAQEREIVQRNAAKPRPLASVSPQQAESPLSRANAFANGLTDELKAQLFKEMTEAAKRV